LALTHGYPCEARCAISCTISHGLTA